MNEVHKMVAELVSDAEARHRENSVTYWNALHQIHAVCMDNAGPGCRHDMALDFVRQIAAKAVAR